MSSCCSVDSPYILPQYPVPSTKSVPVPVYPPDSEKLKHNEYILCKGKQLKKFKLEFAHLINEASKITQFGLFKLRYFLNIDILFRKSEKAKKSVVLS